MNMNRKGMEMWYIVAMILALLTLIVIVTIIAKSSSESGSLLDKLFGFLGA